jgi:hypothetical protein
MEPDGHQRSTRSPLARQSCPTRSDATWPKTAGSARHIPISDRQRPGPTRSCLDHESSVTCARAPKPATARRPDPCGRMRRHRGDDRGDAPRTWPARSAWCRGAAVDIGGAPVVGAVATGHWPRASGSGLGPRADPRAGIRLSPADGPRRRSLAFLWHWGETVPASSRSRTRLPTAARSRGHGWH